MSRNEGLSFNNVVQLVKTIIFITVLVMLFQTWAWTDTLTGFSRVLMFLASAIIASSCALLAIKTIGNKTIDWSVRFTSPVVAIILVIGVSCIIRNI